MKTQALLLSLSASFFLPACGSSSPERYIEKSTKLTCQYTKKCKEADWNEAGYDSVSDCREQTLDAELLPGSGTVRDLFVENCSDFDSGAARTCLAAARKAKRSCDENPEPEPACNDVCGNNEMMGQVLADPANEELVARVLEELVANGELELDIEAPVDELAADELPADERTVEP